MTYSDISLFIETFAGLGFAIVIITAILIASTRR